MQVARIAALLAVCCPLAAFAQAPPASRTIEFRFTPTARAQIALWIEKPDGTFLKTVRLTQAVGYRGIGNRPGAAQMNSGFRWPYGRREGTLPIWAHRRAAAPGAKQFRRVIFQDRDSEGFASRTSNDSTPESYFCLSFVTSTTRKDALDAVTCASAFSSDKGRFITADDGTYAEPAVVGGQGMMRPLDMVSLYPPRRDVTSCRDSGCPETADVPAYGAHVREVMPDIDTVTMATPPAGVEQSVLFSVPSDWTGAHVAWIEVNVEGDYNQAFNAETFPTPEDPSGKWDIWALTYGYPYRGQPSVVYNARFDLGSSASTSTKIPTFYGDPDGFGPVGGAMNPISDGRITDDAVHADAIGSGADRLQLGENDYRFRVTVRGTELCEARGAPAVPAVVRAAPVGNPKHSHEWGQLHFVVPASDNPIVHYEVRYSTLPITTADPATFDQALPALAAKIDTEALMVPTGGAAGAGVDVDFGGLAPQVTYYVAIRAVDMCNVPGPYAVATLTTSRVNFTQLSGCFVATAAYGSALEPEVESLRHVRDTLRPRSPLFAAATDIYYRSGPAAAAVIARSEQVRAVVRSLLGPIVDLSQAVSRASPAATAKTKIGTATATTK
ncbi:MAG: CFI-box-CTERM domain-containing protein [Pseudomonadota bacterium]